MRFSRIPYISASVLTALAGVLMTAVTSCVDKDYDLSKEISSDMGVDGSFSFPLGSSEFISMGGLLGIDGFETGKDADGNYYITLLPPTDFSAAIGLPYDLPDSTAYSGPISVEIPEQILDIQDVSSIMDGYVIDLYNPVITLTAGNPLPTELYLNGDIDALSGGVSTLSSPLHIGGDGEEDNRTDEIVLQADKETVVHLSKLGYGEVTDGQDVTLPRLGEMLTPIPEQVSIGMRLDGELDESVVLSGADTCSISLRIDALLAFGPDFYLTYETSLTGLQEIILVMRLLGIELDVSQLEVDFDIVSSVPLGLTVEGEPIDADGNVISGVDAEITGVVEPGTVENPSVSPAVVVINIEEGTLDVLDGFELYMTGTSDESVAGTPLNANQGIRLKNIYVNVTGRLASSGTD